MTRIKIIIKDYILDIAKSFSIEDKLNKQVYKLENFIFDKGLGFEKIKIKNHIFLYTFRIDIHYRAYLRKEKGNFIIFDINNHDYQSIIKKLKNSG